jgi:hypothetical protein
MRLACVHLPRKASGRHAGAGCEDEQVQRHQAGFGCDHHQFDVGPAAPPANNLILTLEQQQAVTFQSCQGTNPTSLRVTIKTKRCLLSEAAFLVSKGQLKFLDVEKFINPVAL